MGFFGSSSSDNKTSSSKIRTAVIKTQNVAKELLALSQANGVSIESLDFNVLDIQTFTATNDGKKDVEFEEISNDELYELDDVKALLNKSFELKQMYEIEVYSKEPKDDKFPNFNIAIGANASKCKVYLSIKSGSKIEYFKGFQDELAILINNKKLRAGILINIFDEILSEVVSILSSKVKVEKNLEYHQNETILIAQSIEPTPTIDDEIIIHYDKKNDIAKHEKIDYSSRGFIQNVVKDELLIEYIKPKKGTSGRNCKGLFLEAPEPLETNVPEFNIDETILQKDTQDSIKYIANENGYVTFEDNTYAIKTDVDVESISFKSTGSISAGLDSNVSMSVKEEDSSKDAVGAGMEVEVTEIDIDGNMGPNSKLNALRATIGGQTHKSSVIRSEKLDINIHKGTAYGKKIHITRLEHGIIDGDIIDIGQAMGGDIRGKEVYIEICGSYVKATSSKIIEIKKLQGSENVFTIDSLLKKSSQKGLEKNENKISELEIATKNIKKEINKYTIMIKDNKPAFKELKKRLLHYKKNGVQMPSSFVDKYKQFLKIEAHLKTIKNEYAVKQDKLILLTTKTASFQDNIFDARIINRDRWVGYNKLIFKLVDPPIEVVYEPPEGSQDKIFGLVEDEDGRYSIEPKKEE
ncbi:MAG: FapA family protein [Sulfurimonas sp.]|nr:FapA family protein [Sulfurimonas sp.]